MTADLGHHYIAGAWRSDAPHGSHPVENPSDRSVIGTAPDGSAELAREAVIAARTAFATTDWASNPRQRAAALLEFADILESRADAIAALMARENGKLLAQARSFAVFRFGIFQNNKLLRRDLAGQCHFQRQCAHFLRHANRMTTRHGSMCLATADENI